MTSTQTVWVPSGDLTPEQALALSVVSPSTPRRDEYQELLAQKLQQWVDKDQPEATRAMEMSREQAPEPFLLSQTEPPQEWGMSLTTSDSVQSLLNRVRWNEPGSQMPQPISGLRQFLEQLP